MDAHIIGLIAGIIVFASSLPYAIRVWQKKITINIASWFVWTIIGFALYVNYKANGGKESAYAALFGFINPTLVTIIALFRGTWEKLKWYDWICLLFGLIAICIWFYFQNQKILTKLGLWYDFVHKDTFIKYSLFISIFGDACAAIATFIFLIKEPDKDRPFAWIMFSLGYGVSLFAVTEYTFMQCILPLYMFVFPLIIALPLVWYRVKNKIPVTQWI